MDVFYVNFSINKNREDFQDKFRRAFDKFIRNSFPKIQPGFDTTYKNKFDRPEDAKEQLYLAYEDTLTYTSWRKRWKKLLICF